MSLAQIASLTATQRAFSSQLLHEVFLEDKHYISLTDDEVNTVYRLYMSLNDVALQLRLMDHLSQASQLAVLALLPAGERDRFFEYYPDTLTLHAYFCELPRTAQHEVLAHLDEKRPALADIFSRYIAADTTTNMTHIALPDSLDSDTLYASLLDDHASIDSTVRLAELYAQQCSSTELLQLGQFIVHRFNRDYAYIGHKLVFKKYLRVVHFLDRVVLAQPALTSTLKPLYDQLLAILCVFNANWILPIMKQIPLRIAQACFERLRHYERITDFEKRGLYGKLLNKVKRQAAATDADYLQFLLNKG